MQQHQLRPPKGAKRRRKIVGRGDGSGHGSYSGKGMKGQKARSGGGVRLGFQGGQNPLVKSLPSLRGFTNIFRKDVSALNVRELALRFEAGASVGPDELKAKGLVKRSADAVKILGDGELDRALTVRAHAFSASAREKIEKAGGSCEVLASSKGGAS